MALRELDEKTFDEAVSDPEMPLLVDFWARWCGPCRDLAPVIKRLAREYEGRIEFGKVNVDDWPELSQQYRVRSIPTMIIFRDGKPVTRLSGFHSESRLRPHLERYALPPIERSEPVPAAGSSLWGGVRRLFAR